ncbi:MULTISPECIES: alpha/beta fold hydrolase [Bradyrhizobium]|uniref:alpha/beta fold hydrolase n=1 Tax=Bradyrhizobium TaxID=374 RepID=UPI00155F4E4E|nr:MULTISPECIES: alpha/beta hydrolase [Bradyrhizobium]MDD1522031.1 alpha/beta hydrolase [Bradyrhizobium sp. WBAH30]MDD1545406.1 alpha/beta hydrolase [Bradyrhizobium sp. WBAH41]MDD1558631.1 alpha/beta hydrolase [Bradyrhizobium sp. WBAH23]MDD1566556.1 alpha/beta hydrolase [Bradyrhizobium sp. WBAH33]MDD1593025.1 alpha/beta hydrolase [Bradyrhizobium sp. WBAH42]
MKLAREGIQLSFDIAGKGSPEFLFVHGLGGDRTHFAPQMEYFGRHGRALNAELRGHGESDKPHQDYSIEGFAEDLVWLCARQEITKPVIVGQSMGGNMALEIAARYPDFPAGLVLLDSGVLFPASAGAVFTSYLEGLQGPNFADEIRKIVADSCLPTDRCHAHVEQTFLATPQHVLVSTFRSLFPWDVHRAGQCAQACRVPVLYIEAAHRLADLNRLGALCPQLVTAKAVGSGHFLSLEVPEQIDAMIDRFISLYVQRRE